MAHPMNSGYNSWVCHAPRGTRGTGAASFHYHLALGCASLERGGVSGKTNVPIHGLDELTSSLPATLDSVSDSDGVEYALDARARRIDPVEPCLLGSADGLSRIGDIL